MAPHNDGASGEAKKRPKRANRTASLPVGNIAKIRLIKTNAIRVAVAPTQWALPTGVELNILKNEITTAIWGRKRTMRCKETLYGILFEGSRIEPALAMVQNAIANARRILTKNQRIQDQTVEMVSFWNKKEEDGDDKFLKNSG